MSRPLRWALVGASDIAATKVLPALRAAGDEAVVVRSGNAEHAARWAKEHDVPEAVSELAAALERDDVDAVYVSSVNAQHRAHVEAAAAAGKHVLAEKPLALTLDDAQAMVAACRAAGVVMATNHHLPASPTHRTLKRALHDGLVGDVRAVRVHHAVQLPERLAGWRVDDPVGGGVVLDVTVHDAAAVAALLGGTALSVEAVGLNQDNDPGGPFDAVMTSAEWTGGVLVQTHDAYNNPHLPTSLHVLGTEGALVADDCNTGDPVGSVTLWRDHKAESLDVGPRADLYEVTVRAIGAAVAGDGEVVVTGEDGVRSLAYSLAALESLRTAARATVPPLSR
ncbi:MAG: Gfo/Idh/MocA family oxidoreductase [Saccharothrix sp.]|nr:Gfo/Idh/MocA family oxidoreductase [Saccharothrix sp.]